jgi:hypothetical protein
MRRLQTPTRRPWGCSHQWKTTHRLPQEGTWHRRRYHKCLPCGLRVKTEERLAVPWDQGTLRAMGAQAFPSENPVSHVAFEREHNERDRVLSAEEFAQVYQSSVDWLKPIALLAY